MISLKELTKQLRAIAEVEGTTSAYWELIYEIEAFLRGVTTVLKATEEQYITMVLKRLNYEIL